MIKEDNTRIIITLSKKQAKWLKDTAKKTHMSVSKLCKWLMDKNISRIAQMMTEEELKTMIKIARTPWIKMYDEEE